MLSGRPATVQYSMRNPLPDDGPRDDLFAPAASERLALLRHHIQIAQGRAQAKGEAAGAGMTVLRQVLAPPGAMMLFLGLWEWLVRVNGWPNYKVASPSDLWPAFWKFRWLFLECGWQTLWRKVAGLLLAIVVGVGRGMVTGLSRTARAGLYPLLVGFDAIPKATVAPILALMFVVQHDMNTILNLFMISVSRSPFRCPSGCRRSNPNSATSCGLSARAG